MESSSPRSQRSLVLPSLILGASLIVSAMIIKEVKSSDLLTLYATTVTQSAVRKQFDAHMTQTLAGKVWGDERLTHVETDEIKFDSQTGNFRVFYGVHFWDTKRNIPTAVYTGCELSPGERGYTGSCKAANGLEPTAKHEMVRVVIN